MMLLRALEACACMQALGGSSSSTVSNFAWGCACAGCERVHRWWHTKDMGDGKTMMGKPSVFFRKVVNADRGDGVTVAVNAQLYTVLVMDVPDLRAEQEQCAFPLPLHFRLFWSLSIARGALMLNLCSFNRCCTMSRRHVKCLPLMVIQANFLLHVGEGVEACGSCRMHRCSVAG